METIHRDYSPKGVKFYYIYKALAHPETNGYVTPFTLEERLLHVKAAQSTLGSKFTWICDTMENDLKHALGNAPNSEFIIDPDGKVVAKRAWSDARQLRADLEKFVGPSEKTTTVAELNLVKHRAPMAAAKGIVPRIRLPGRMQALEIFPNTDSKEPFYVKLRAEIDEAALRNGEGKLYLGFHLDPLYHVHWNNLAAPLKFEIEKSDGVKLSSNQGEAPQVKEPSDVDPREFLLDFETSPNAKPLKISVSYFACNDDEGWCKPVTQTYTISLEVDRDGGSRSNRQRGSRFNSGGRPSFQPGRFPPSRNRSGRPSPGRNSPRTPQGRSGPGGLPR